MLVDLFISLYANGTQAITVPTSDAGLSTAAPGDVPSSFITASEHVSISPALGMSDPYVHNLEAFLTGYVGADFVCTPERWALIGGSSAIVSEQEST